MAMLKVTEVAERLGVSRQTVLTYINKGLINAQRYVREYRIDEEEVERLKKGE